MSNYNWNELYNTDNVDIAYNLFWMKYNTSFESIFPVTKIKFNKNVHKIHNYMSEGLLLSRTTKLNLHKQCLVNPNPISINMYKQYRNVYNSTLRAAKKLHIQALLRQNQNDPKKTWQILNELTGRSAKSVKIEKI